MTDPVAPEQAVDAWMKVLIVMSLVGSMVFSVPATLSVEAHMGCGFGICLGCAIPTADGSGSYKLACTDGPCLPAEEILP